MSARPRPAPPARPRAAAALVRQQRALLAAEALSRADTRMARLVKRIGPHRPVLTADPFRALVGSIIQQQVSMSAAAAIQKRLRQACDGRIRPETVLGLESAALRGCGLSRQKAAYLHDLAQHFAEGRLTSRQLRRLEDEAVIAAVTQVKGVGRWTAEMLLIFCLERPDVWPIDDLGLRKAVRFFAGLAEMPAAEVMRTAGEPFRPYRTYASWYLWRSLEGPFMPGVSL
ncbi:MAG: DNA-3-methyladenine glycosylase [Phycisphaerae bacterium]|nr:DNA-3-methyladenine glycosylase 2 family protein [Phycisphaerae bacterium]MCZ2400922.1 DNA-3-methyladenine glycosylase [Phycisphaerae bacterium]